MLFVVEYLSRFHAIQTDRFNSNLKTNSEIELIKWQFFYVVSEVQPVESSYQCKHLLSARFMPFSLYCSCCKYFSRLFSISKRNEFVSPVLVTVFSIQCFDAAALLFGVFNLCIVGVAVSLFRFHFNKSDSHSTIPFVIVRVLFLI